MQYPCQGAGDENLQDWEMRQTQQKWAEVALEMKTEADGRDSERGGGGMCIMQPAAAACVPLQGKGCDESSLCQPVCARPHPVTHFSRPSQPTLRSAVRNRPKMHKNNHPCSGASCSFHFFSFFLSLFSRWEVTWDKAQALLDTSNQ